jgi:hypothetical protein
MVLNVPLFEIFLLLIAPNFPFAMFNPVCVPLTEREDSSLKVGVSKPLAEMNEDLGQEDFRALRQVRDS